MAEAAGLASFHPLSPDIAKGSTCFETEKMGAVGRGCADYRGGGGREGEGRKGVMVDLKESSRICTRACVAKHFLALPGMTNLEKLTWVSKFTQMSPTQ